MSRASKTAVELEAIIMKKLRSAHPECDNYIAGVIVNPADGAGHWIAETKGRDGISVPSDCHRVKAAIANKLRRQYALAS